MCGTVPNPTLAALVVAVGQQLDVVDAAVHALQVRLFRAPFFRFNRTYIFGSACLLGI